jgi:hypothetical protein
MYFWIEPHTETFESTFFTSINNIHLYYPVAKRIKLVIVKSINNLQEITINPTSYTGITHKLLLNAGTLKLYELDNDNIIFGESYDLYDCKTIKKFKLPITYKYLLELCRYNRVDTLEYLKNKIIELIALKKNHWAYGTYDVKTPLHTAILYENIEVLQWLYNNIDLKSEVHKYNSIIRQNSYHDFYNILSSKGRVDILNWLYDAGFKLVICEMNVCNVSENGHANVLQWFFEKNKLDVMKFNKISIEVACSKGHVNVLEWWHKNNVPIECSHDLLLEISVKGHVNVLNWFKESINKMTIPSVFLNNICGTYSYSDENTAGFEWWVNSGLIHYADVNLFGSLTRRCRQKSLEILRKSNIRVKYGKYDKVFMKIHYKDYDCDWWFEKKDNLKSIFVNSFYM